MSTLATNSDKPRPIGGRHGAWPGFEPTRRATHQRPSDAGVEGAEVPEGLAAVPVGGSRARAKHKSHVI